MLVSDVQKSESLMHIPVSTLVQILFLCRPLKLSFKFILFYQLRATCGIFIPAQSEIEPGPLTVRAWSLTTGPPGNSQLPILYIVVCLCQSPNPNLPLSSSLEISSLWDLSNHLYKIANLPHLFGTPKTPQSVFLLFGNSCFITDHPKP